VQLAAATDVCGRGSQRPDRHHARAGERRAKRVDLRTDPLSGRLVAFAPNRRRRPGGDAEPIEEPTEAELDECPFCEGREDRTPPEVFRVGTKASWIVRVVPNLYPAFEHQEVVVHSPRHVRTFAALTDEEVAAVAEAWRARRDANAGYMHACVNEGRAAGSSLAHSHSQLVWLPAPPPEVERERGRAAHLDDGLVVAERGPTRAAVHAAGRLPYETLIAGDPFELGAALLLLRDVVRRLRAVEGPVPWNAWLHEDHVELVPRLSVLAGVELGAGIYVNTVAPEDAAAALRGG
jgi:UDPglucose--hexose-1-phosphate uridylyltransferase